MNLDIPSAIKEKFNNSSNALNGDLYEEYKVNLHTCLEMKELTHLLKILRNLTDDTLNTTLNDSKLPDFQSRKKHYTEIIKEEILPTWISRDNLLKTCNEELIQYKKQLDLAHVQKLDQNKDILDFETPRSNIDPYSKRDLVKKTTSDYERYNNCKRWIEQQKGVEKIIKNKTFVSLKAVCNDQSSELKSLADYITKS